MSIIIDCKPLLSNRQMTFCAKKNIIAAVVMDKDHVLQKNIFLRLLKALQKWITFS